MAPPHKTGVLAGLWTVGGICMLAGHALAQQTAPPPKPQIAAGAEIAPTTAAMPAPHDPTKGAVTNLPVPRYVSLKTNQGNARRGPGLSHRVDWVFTRAGTPLRVTAEYENWRRIEDSEGLGGWVHYTLLSGVRSVLILQDMADIRSDPLPDAMSLVQAEQGVVGDLLQCAPDWCRIAVDGYKGWVDKSALWGVDPGEVIE